MKASAAVSLLAAAALAGCGGALSTTDGGTGAAGTTGTAGTTGAAGTNGTAGTTGTGSVAGAVVDGATVIDGAAIPPDLKTQLDAAAATWAATKSSCGIYSYDRRWMSVFGGGGSTEVEIRNDVATRRRQSIPLSPADGGGHPVPTDWMTIWDETGSDVGSHPSSWNVFPASTVEQLLAECATVLAQDPAQNTLRLIVDGHGVPMTCTYFPANCADDCLVGITLVGFACAPLAN